MSECVPSSASRPRSCAPARWPRCGRDGAAAAPRADARDHLPEGDRRRRRDPGRARARRPRGRAPRSSRASTGSAWRAGPTSTRSPTAPSSATAELGPTERRARRLRARRRARRRRRRPAAARHLPRRPGAQRRPRRDAAPARRRPPPDRGRDDADAARRGRARLAAGRDHRRGEALEVNCFHHQAVDALGAGLRVVARAADGTVEAIEDPARPFVLGVQWHAETLTERPEHGALFAALVAGRGRAARCAWPPRPRAVRAGSGRRARGGAASARSSPAVELGQRRALGGLDLEQQRRVVLAQHGGDAAPRQRAAPRRQVEVELQRVDRPGASMSRRRTPRLSWTWKSTTSGATAASDEGGVAVRRVGGDVQVADVEQHPGGRRGQPAHEVAHGQRVVAQPRRPGCTGARFSMAIRHAKRVRPLEVADGGSLPRGERARGRARRAGPPASTKFRPW